ncbi:hypothetical protein ACLOJK_022445 [Asimina triloba]
MMDDDKAKHNCKGQRRQEDKMVRVFFLNLFANGFSKILQRNIKGGKHLQLRSINLRPTLIYGSDLISKGVYFFSGNDSIHCRRRGDNCRRPIN